MSEHDELEREFQEGADAVLPDDSDPMGLDGRMQHQARGRTTRHIFMAALLITGFALLSFLLRDELLYFFTSGQPTEMGQAEELRDQPLAHNRFLAVEGVARDMCIRSEAWRSRTRYLYLMGSELGARILIEAPDPDSAGCPGAVERRFAGRLVDLSLTHRYDAVLAYYRKHFLTAPAEGPIYLLRHDVSPGDLWPYPAALGLMLLLAGLHMVLLIRSRRRKAAAEGDMA
ncbi:MAG: hypothetical protein JRF33_01070 [Deltaproteobacteria bacterium]|nr:hypothetical protein [Deltaproteobacteria bacterium]